MSPEYDAEIVTNEPGISFVAVYWTLQFPEEDSVQVFAEKVPTPLVCQVTVPVGLYPVTVTVQDVLVPLGTFVGLQVTAIYGVICPTLIG